MTTAEQLGPGGLNDKKQPIFIATDHTKYAALPNHELTDQELLAWKTFQLWRTSMSIERRNNVYKDLINSDYTNPGLHNSILGSPYPVVENAVSMVDGVKGIRWYEHAFCIGASVGYCYWVKSKAAIRMARATGALYPLLFAITFGASEICCGYRSVYRLTGYLPNDYECRKFGVMETKEALEHKKEMWEKYAAYKKEWCRRYDYHVFGIRPGENWSLFSACWLPAWKPRFNTCTDYPLRKNPYFLTAAPLREAFIDPPSNAELNREDNVPLIRARPELKYLYNGPSRV